MIVVAILAVLAALSLLVVYACRRAGVSSVRGGAGAGSSNLLFVAVDATAGTSTSHCDVGSIDCGGHGGH